MIIMIKKKTKATNSSIAGNDLLLTMTMTKKHLKATNSSIVGLAMI